MAASSLGDCTFLVSQPEDSEVIMSSLEKIFTEKSGKAGNNALPEDFYALQTAGGCLNLKFSLLGFYETSPNDFTLLNHILLLFKIFFVCRVVSCCVRVGVNYKILFN